MIKRKNGKFVYTLILVIALVAVSAPVNAKYIEGDALVVFKASAEDNGCRITTSSVANPTATTITAFKSSAKDIRVVTTFDGLTALSFQNAQNASGVSVASVGSRNNLEPGVFALVHSDTLSTEELIASLRARDDVLAASPNHVMHLTSAANATPNEPAFAGLTYKDIGFDLIDGYHGGTPETEVQWGIKTTQAPEVWALDVANSTGSDQVYVTVVDTGIDSKNPDIAENFSTQYSQSFLEKWGADSNDYTDGYGHGTHVAGTIAARGNNGRGVVGMTWNSKLIALRIFDSDGQAYGSEYINALSSLAEILTNNPDITLSAVNLSLGGYYYLDPQAASRSDNAEWYAYKTLDSTNRIVIVVSAGNESLEVGMPAPRDDYEYNTYRRGDYAYPASFLGLNNMIVVAAADSNFKIADFEYWGSNYSSEYVHVAAPGAAILSTVSYKNDGYCLTKLPNDDTPLAVYPGTSMAAPHVAGAVALLKAVVPDATPAQIKTAICEGANKSYCTTGAHRVKYGFLDVKAAYDYLSADGHHGGSGGGSEPLPPSGGGGGSGGDDPTPPGGGSGGGDPTPPSGGGGSEPTPSSGGDGGSGCNFGVWGSLGCMFALALLRLKNTAARYHKY